MSSTMTQTELKNLSTAPTNMDEKQSKLVRSSSIDRIKRFNSYICSQQYYILPAILNWLKSSQSGLQLSAEKTIFFFRSLFFRSVLYKYFLLGVKSSGVWTVEELPGAIVNLKNLTIIYLNNVCVRCSESSFPLVIAVYSACAIILVQFLTTIYLLYFTLVPFGFLFLIGCMVTIKYICYKTLFFYLNKSANKRKCN